MSADLDSLKVSEDSDGTFIIEWDRNDPIMSQFNDMPSEEFETYINNALRKALDEWQKKDDSI